MFTNFLVYITQKYRQPTNRMPSAANCWWRYRNTDTVYYCRHLFNSITTIPIAWLPESAQATHEPYDWGASRG